MIRLCIFIACIMAAREIPRRVEIQIVIPPVQWIEPITSDEEGLLTA